MKLWFLVAITISDFCFAAGGELKPYDAAAIQKAMDSDRQTAERLRTDKNRPGYHFLPAANWMNDPNGPIFHKGWYHMFYQHNPYGEGWGHMHWGHARSADLLHWEHLPIALWPSLEVGEEHIFSGCATIRADGKPVIFYTSIKKGKSATDFAEQWIAVGDDELLRWEKPPQNPALAETLHGETKVWDWRDPFLFKYKGENFLVLGGNLNHGKGGQGVVNLYKAKEPSLMSWGYLGVLFQHPDPKVANIECPNFFELNGKWVLVVSPHGRVEYFIGQFDGTKFSPESQGLLDTSDNYYAPNSTTDVQGRRLIWGWVRGFKDKQGWNGCLTLPRELTIDERGQLQQRPATELRKLRGEKLFEAKELSLTEPKKIKAKSSQFEIEATFAPGGGSGLRLFIDGNNSGLEISYSNGELNVGEKNVPLPLHAVDFLNLHIFVDHTVLEIYGNHGFVFSKVFYPTTDGREIEFFSRDQKQILNAVVHELKSIW